MVNNQNIRIHNISKFNRGSPPARESLIDGPIYDKDEIIALAQAHKQQLATKNSNFYAAAYKLSPSQISDLLLESFQTGVYHQSEWCIVNQNKIKNITHIYWAACDSRLISKTYVNADGQPFKRDWFLKYAISSSGEMILFISNHEENEK